MNSLVIFGVLSTALLAAAIFRRYVYVPSLPASGRCTLVIDRLVHYQLPLTVMARGLRYADRGLPKTARLIPEGESHAAPVRVEIEGHVVGYLHAADAQRYRASLAASRRAVRAYKCRSEIRGGEGDSYSVWLDLPQPVMG
ncbi:MULTISPECIES: hypothetical protein [Hydrocarboniphaga]|uniref:HIRAN domain-containing protein n=1 Tax=Hydrocarboniphaga effusa AP103 TaxID=1172194 RepID=I8T4P7_9GAMM|nr:MULTISPECIES: hypothetical protein [Hydrocarboniphaga]EIT68905.1 hypothetical protein WQQ_24870 [Hydrocarboniphaga effusa AP103]MDZ4080566.1 hypothetical protein [Hydrocarboniphaga sp.]